MRARNWMRHSSQKKSASPLAEGERARGGVGFLSPIAREKPSPSPSPLRRERRPCLRSQYFSRHPTDNLPVGLFISFSANGYSRLMKSENERFTRSNMPRASSCVL